jgi:hypothetical protein
VNTETKQVVLLQDVLNWIWAALEAAREDHGDEGGTTTALSYRRLEVTLAAMPGHPRVEVVTWNTEFTGDRRREWGRTTDDGIEVRWNDADRGIPTGADWLPWEFISWITGAKK